MSFNNQRTFTVVVGSKSFVVCNPMAAELLKLANEAHQSGAKAVKKELTHQANKVEIAYAAFSTALHP
jgi:hypothetical protein